jgi:hypothetical protein
VSRMSVGGRIVASSILVFFCLQLRGPFVWSGLLENASAHCIMSAFAEYFD